ncbi:hypothetical protein ACWPKO_05155 [Coraliomargarita sp. W4R53]
MKLNDTGISNWVVELHDGAFEIQRTFQFKAKADLNAFVSFVGNYMESPSLRVFSTSVSLPSPQVEVRIHLLPEAVLLKAAGEIAATCEHEYTLLQAQSAKFAA